MKSYTYYLPVILLLVAGLTTNLFGQPTSMRGQEGDICYEAEYAFVYRTEYGGQLFQEYINCVARHYREGNINLYEVRQRVGHGMELMKVFESLAWTRCINLDDDNCSSDYITYLLELDSDNDGEEDIFDPTPFGENPNEPFDFADEDGDGVVDRVDECPNTQAGLKVNDQGCPKLVLKAQTVHPFYTLDDEYFMLIGRVMDPTGTVGVGGAAVVASWFGPDSHIGTYSDAEGAFEIELPASDALPQTYEVRVTAGYEDYMMSNITVTFAVRPHLSVNVETDKRDYLASERIQISGQVFSPEPIASDLEISCEVQVYDQYGTNAPPYRLQRVHLRSDGTFSYEVPIYGPDEQGKWLESGEFGTWMIKAQVEKDGEVATDLKAISVYRTQVDRDKATRAFWDRANEQGVGEALETLDQAEIYQRPSHKESIILGPKTKALFEATAALENRLKVVDGSILYLKDMRLELIKQQELISEINGDYMIVEGQYIDCSSRFSAFIVEVDPLTQTDRVTVYNGPITISSKDGRFTDLELDRGDQVTINSQGVHNERSLSWKTLQELGQPFELALNGENPVALRHQSESAVDPLSPDYQPTLVELLVDYAWYIVSGVVGLLLIVLLLRKSGKRQTQTEVSPPPDSDDGWGATSFCTNCGQVLPAGSKFCSACGTKVA